MTTRHTPAAQAALAAPAVPTLPGTTRQAGSWHLGRGHALHLRGKEAAVLHITAGRVWATLDGPHVGPANNQGDLVLVAGDHLTVPAGQSVVIEPWGRAAQNQVRPNPALQDEAFFSWDPLPADGAAGALGAARAASRSRLQLAVGDPLRELGRALWLVALALGHLVTGVAGLSEFLVAGRGRVLPRLESNSP
jgi:Protein of unknown function (DUF2917)